MKIELPDHYVAAVIRALENQAAAMKSLLKDDRPYLEAVEFFRQPEPKSAGSEESKPAKRKRA